MNTSMEQQTQYDIKEILKKIVEELDQKIDTVTNRKNNEITKSEFASVLPCATKVVFCN